MEMGPPHACNGLSIGVQTLCQLLVVLLKCLWAPSLGRGRTGIFCSPEGIQGGLNEVRRLEKGSRRE